MKHNIVWFDVPVLDLDRSIRFYAAVLGAPVTKMAVRDMTMGMLSTTDGGSMGCLVATEDFRPSADGIMVYFDVDGRLRDAVAQVRAHGGTVQRDIHPIGEHGFRAEVLDSEGNCIALHSRSDT